MTTGTTMDNVGGNIYWATTAELQSNVPGVPREYGLGFALRRADGQLRGAPEQGGLRCGATAQLHRRRFLARDESG